MSAVLVAQGLTLALGGRRVLDGVALDLRRGEWAAVVGPNGAGKSTLLTLLAGLRRPDAGRVELDGRPIGAWGARERAQRVAWLSQHGEADGDIAARDVVRLGRLPHHGLFGSVTAADEAAVDAAMAETECAAFASRRLSELSGGERQRVLLARALAVQAPLLLMDEPLAHLDPPHQADWLALAREQVAAGGTVVSVLHELGMALQADELLIVRNGRVVHHGACASPATHRALQVAFDGRVEVRQVDHQWVALPRIPQEASVHAD